MEEAFSKVVEQIFSNWTALKLAVEHSMAGVNSRQVAIDCMNYMVQYCLYEKDVQAGDIQEVLEDLLDEEFETICQDDSPKEISLVMFKFLELLRAGNFSECEVEFNKLPTHQEGWLVQSKPQPQLPIPVQQTSSDEAESSSTQSVEPMEEDSEWTHVKSRRKR